MGDLRTTAEERARLRLIYSPDGHYSLPNTYTQKLLGDLDTLLAENARLRAAEAEGERLRALAAEARDMLRAMPWRRGGDALVARLDRAALGEP